MPSEARRAFSEDGANKTHIGGQALIEGVMMRGKLGWAAAVREPSGGIYVEEHPLSKKGERPAWMRLPLVRGCVALVDSLALGFKALEVAASHAYDEEGETFESLQGRPRGTGKGNLASENPEPNESLTGVSDGAGPKREEASTSSGESFFGKAEMLISVVLGVGLGVGLFILLPALVSNLLVGDYDVNPFVWNVIDGVLRVAIFIAYIWLISLLPDIKRMFSYHGAEHKTIHCFEHGLPLTPENARQFPRLHVRCGTAFMVMVMVLAILVYTLVPVDQLIYAWGVTDSAAKFLLVVLVRIALMPVIAGITYEVTVRWAGSNPDNPVVRIVLWPGMQMQRLTTNEPDDGMLECAIAAMRTVLAQEEEK